MPLGGGRGRRGRAGGRQPGLQRVVLVDGLRRMRPRLPLRLVLRRAHREHTESVTDSQATPRILKSFQTLTKTKTMTLTKLLDSDVSPN